MRTQFWEGPYRNSAEVVFASYSCNIQVCDTGKKWYDFCYTVHGKSFTVSCPLICMILYICEGCVELVDCSVKWGITLNVLPVCLVWVKASSHHTHIQPWYCLKQGHGVVFYNTSRPGFNTQHFKKMYAAFLFQKTITQWNSLPSELATATTLEAFTVPLPAIILFPFKHLSTCALLSRFCQHSISLCYMHHSTQPIPHTTRAHKSVTGRKGRRKHIKYYAESATSLSICICRRPSVLCNTSRVFLAIFFL